LPEIFFSKISKWRKEFGEKRRQVSIFHFPYLFFTLVFILQLCAGCKTAAPLPPTDFSAPGWSVLSGQAVWQPPQNRPELAGDLLLATNVNGSFFVQFTKVPFPLVTAEVKNHQWQIEFGADKYSWHGRGEPPARFSWFQLPSALLGENLSRNWHFENMTNGSWRLENSRTGEKLEGAFFP
jgi:hypothetical protein